MRIGNQIAAWLGTKGRRKVGRRPTGEGLESRALLTGFAIDLVNVAGDDAGPAPGPYGVLEVNINDNTGAGYSSTVVGDVNGDGFDDYVLGAPGIQVGTPGPVLSSSPGQAYLIFGSAQVGGPTVDWRTLTAQQRIGSLSQLGNINQNNPVNGSPGFSFNGLIFSASQQGNNNLGASVAPLGDVNNDGFADFILGAPGALDATGTVANTGRAYLVYGDPGMTNFTTPFIDFDNNSATDAIDFVTFVNNTAAGGSLTGFSVGGVSNFLTPPFTDVVIGAPLASINGLSQNGAAYVVSRAVVQFQGQFTVNLSLVGQGGSTNVLGLIFAGAATGDQAGASVAGAGNFDGDRNQAGVPLGDLLIGATQSQTGPGAAYVVYGATNLINQGIAPVGGLSVISLARITSTTNTIAGAVFTGDSAGDQTGFTVSTAGDFNADGLSDIAIGSPFWNGPNGVNSGRVNLIYGRSINPDPPGRITGTFSLSGLPSNIPAVQFDGPGTNAQAGFSISAIGPMQNGDSINEFLIGAPGFLNSQGVAYVIPGNPDLVGEFPLATAIGNDLNATVISLSTPASGNYLGSSVGGGFVNSSGFTVDADGFADFTVGAAGLNFSGSDFNAGGGYLLEGASNFVPLAPITSNAVTSPIAIEDFPSAPVINPTTPDDLIIYILSGDSNPPDFQPFAFINPDTIQVNGIALPDPSTFVDAGDLDGDGISDAQFTFSPRSLLALPANTTLTITVSARTLTTAPAPFTNRRYTGVQTVRTTGSTPTPPQPGISLSFGPQFQNLNRAAPRFGERMLPQLQVINRARWAPLNTRVAYRQFLPRKLFAQRQNNYFHPAEHKTKRTRTLGPNVFTRGRFPKGVFVGAVKYKTPVIGNGQNHIFPK